MPRSSANGRYYANGRAYTRPYNGSGYAVPRHPYNNRYYGKGYGHGHYGHGYYGRYYYPYYGGYYPYYGYPYWGYYGYPYYWGAYAYPYYGWPSLSFGFYYGGGGGGYDVSDEQGAARLEVKPRETEVFVDGYFTGIVDDFDGSKRLRLEPGEHEVTLYLDGYRPITRRMLFTRGQTFRVEHVMEPLAAGESVPSRPVPSARPAPPQQAPPPGYGGSGNGSGSMRPAVRVSDAPPASADALERATDISIVAPTETARGVAGTLSVRVQPEDAEVIVDGDAWARSGGERLVLSLAPGLHRVEVRREGFEPYNALVRVRPGTTTTVNVALTPAERR